MRTTIDIDDLLLAAARRRALRLPKPGGMTNSKVDSSNTHDILIA
jgi:hypothetical protein